MEEVRVHRVKMTSRGRPRNQGYWIRRRSVKDPNQGTCQGPEYRLDLRAQDGESEFGNTLKKWTNRISGVGKDRRSGQDFSETD